MESKVTVALTKDQVKYLKEVLISEKEIEQDNPNGSPKIIKMIDSILDRLEN